MFIHACSHFGFAIVFPFLFNQMDSTPGEASCSQAGLLENTGLWVPPSGWRLELQSLCTLYRTQEQLIVTTHTFLFPFQQGYLSSLNMKVFSYISLDGVVTGGLFLNSKTTQYDTYKVTYTFFHYLSILNRFVVQSKCKPIDVWLDRKHSERGELFFFFFLHVWP